MDRSEILKYFVDEYFGGDIESVVKATQYTPQQVRRWLDGEVQPIRNTIEYVAHCALAPEFRIVVEFAHFSPDNPVRPQLRNALQGYGDLSGIYAFYDSMAILLYIGKADRLLERMYSSILQDIDIEFPQDLVPPQRLHEVVGYFSAYEIRGRAWAGYPKYIESLILRISKPPINENIGYLERLEPLEEC